MKDVLKRALDACNISIDDGKVATLTQFYTMLVEWNEKFNLTRIVSPEDAAMKHFCDSLMGKDMVSGKVCDVGSGGGFPSIPLAIVRPELDFTLIESNGKKAGFLEAVAAELGLKNVRVVKVRAEDAAALRESFDTVTARAVASLNTLLEYCLPLVKVGGPFVAYKGASFETELAESQNALNVLGGKVDEVVAFSLPDASGERALIRIFKAKNTPPKYPRGQGKPRSKPL
jgi:16S rRNA (guanine527-N7)-methyltransferase